MKEPINLKDIVDDSVTDIYVGNVDFIESLQEENPDINIKDFI